MPQKSGKDLARRLDEPHAGRAGVDLIHPPRYACIMPAGKGKRSPLLSLVLMLIALALMLRSLFASDRLFWQSISDQKESVIDTSFGLETARLGLGVFYGERLVSARNRKDVDAVLLTTRPGANFAGGELPENPTLARRFGFSFDRQLDDRPESFKNEFALFVPLWLIAGLLAIGPARWLAARRAVARQANSTKPRAAQEDRSERRSDMRIAAIGLLAGLMIGGVVMFAVLRYRSAGDATQASGASFGAAPAAEETDRPPIHPIVGSWRIRIESITATYRFGNDNSFLLKFKNMPMPGAQEAGGTWRVNDDKLSMVNKWSNTPMTVVGEEESARIVALEPEKLVLQNIDRKGRPELLAFERVWPFVKGKSDKKAIVGAWQGPQYTLELNESGDAVMTWSGQRTGEWSQRGQKLTLMMTPPPVPSAARRAANPGLTEPREEIYDIRSLDEQTMILHRTDLPPTENMVLHRIAEGGGAQPKLPSQRH